VEKDSTPLHRYRSGDFVEANDVAYDGKRIADFDQFPLNFLNSFALGPGLVSPLQEPVQKAVLNLERIQQAVDLFVHVFHFFGHWQHTHLETSSYCV
jgi:hypothetical protein